MPQTILAPRNSQEHVPPLVLASNFASLFPLLHSLTPSQTIRELKLPGQDFYGVMQVTVRASVCLSHFRSSCLSYLEYPTGSMSRWLGPSHQLDLP